MPYSGHERVRAQAARTQDHEKTGTRQGRKHAAATSVLIKAQEAASSSAQVAAAPAHSGALRPASLAGWSTWADGD